MALPYSYRLGDHVGTAQGVWTLFQAPAGYTVVVRDVIVFLRSGTGTAAAWILRTDGSALILAWQDGIDSPGSVRFEGRQVMRPHETLQVYGTTDSWTAIATGYVLIGELVLPGTLPA